MPRPYDIDALAADVHDAVLGYTDERQRVEAIKPLLARWMERQEGLRPEQQLPCEGRPCGHLLHTARDGSFFMISVVFPPGTNSGVHYHGSWGVIGVLSGEDEETKYLRETDPSDVASGQPCDLTKTALERFPPGSITHLLPPDEGFHRVRSIGEETGVSIHILGGTPETHPHYLCESSTRMLVDFPMPALLDQGLPKATPNPS